MSNLLVLITYKSAFLIGFDFYCFLNSPNIKVLSPVLRNTRM